MSFTPLCQLKWRSPCNQNSLNACECQALTSVHGCKLDWGYVLGPQGAPVLLEKHANYKQYLLCGMFSSVQFSCSVMSNSATPWTAARQGSLFFTNSWSLGKLMSIELVMPSNHLILCHPFLLLPSIFPSNRVFSNESVLHIRWPKCWSFSFNISPSNEYSGLIGLLAVNRNSLKLKFCVTIFSCLFKNH